MIFINVEKEHKYHVHRALMNLPGFRQNLAIMFFFCFAESLPPNKINWCKKDLYVLEISNDICMFKKVITVDLRWRLK